MTTLHDRLADLAADVRGDAGAVPGPGLWDRGVRRARRRRAAGAVLVAVVALLVAGGLSVRPGPPAPPPADVPFEQLHLPEQIRPPGTWSAAGRPTGPLAAVGLSLRTRPEGLVGERQSLQLFGVSAVDGRSGWLDLPGVTDDHGLVGWFALSPDGRWLAWTRSEGSRRGVTPAPQSGWSVMDTTTGRVRHLADPRLDRVVPTATDLTFTGDSRYLLTSYRAPGGPDVRGHRFVAFDVRTGGRRVVEQPGEKWVPSFGSAPSGIVWSRGRTVHRLDPLAGERRSRAFPQSVVAASWGPDDRAFAYVGRPSGAGAGRWRLYAGRSVAQARGRAMPLDVEPAQLLGWRDERHVVVGHFRSDVRVVDVVTGRSVAVDLAGGAEKYNPPLLAADLWRNPLAEPLATSGTTDPRRPYLVGGGAALVATLLALLWSRRRRRDRS